MSCEICPRRCEADRVGVYGFCRVPLRPVVVKTMIHRWEEPPISGTRGSGAVFFAGCNLRCVFCQNHAISRGCAGEPVTDRRLAALFFELAEQGVHNINLVTPSHVVPTVAAAIRRARGEGLTLPFVYNTNGYDSLSSLALLDGLIDIYLPDFKYCDDGQAVRYSAAPGYFQTAAAAVLEMHRQTGPALFSEDGMMVRGLIIRHLVLPGQRRDAMRVLDWIEAHVPDAYVSLLAQYTPSHGAAVFSELNRRVTTFEYDSVVAHFHALGLQHGFVQERGSATEAYIPDFG